MSAGGSRSCLSVQRQDLENWIRESKLEVRGKHCARRIARSLGHRADVGINANVTTRGPFMRTHAHSDTSRVRPPICN